VTHDKHIPVLGDEVVQALNLRRDGVYVDATFGRGGHARAILSRLSSQGRLVALDRDAQAIDFAQKNFSNDSRVAIYHAAFSNLSSVVDAENLQGRVDGVIFDLGVSSPQLNQAERGFSFGKDGPLDMRMDATHGETAAEWLALANEKEIADVIFQYGEERLSRRIAKAIVRERERGPIERTGQLQAIVAGAVPKREPGQDPATRTFQAIRIFINRELDEIAQALPQAVKALAPHGRLAVISFHSLEDRIVKQFFKRSSRDEVTPPKLPVRHGAFTPTLALVGKAVRPAPGEVARNPRARSAILRVAERLAGAYA
jgi:16S rRNA (cytosine1402-N4)-methyltransferase